VVVVVGLPLLNGGGFASSPFQADGWARGRRRTGRQLEASLDSSSGSDGGSRLTYKHTPLVSFLTAVALVVAVAVVDW